MSSKEKKGPIYITHSGELLIWLVILFVIISLSTIFYFNKEKQKNDYNIFMSDVDGLIVGSPVRMMGVEVGHVTKIKPVKNEVYVKFILVDKSMQLPQGTVATVEFSGMAGSKSLELYLPKTEIPKGADVPILTVNQPKRLHDALGLLNDMFDKLGAIIYTSSSFGKKLNDIEFDMNSSSDAKEFLNYTNKLLDDANSRASDLENKIKGANKKWN